MQLMASHSDSFFLLFHFNGFSVPFVSYWEGQTMLFLLQNHVQVSLYLSYTFGWYMEKVFVVHLNTVTLGIFFLSASP